MPPFAFIDIAADEGTAYLFDGAGGKLTGTVSFGLGGEHGMQGGDVPSDVEECALGLPLGMLDFRLLELPFSDAAKVREVLPFELSGLVLEPVENLVMDGVVLGAFDNEASDGNHWVLAVYARKADIARVLAALGGSNLDPAVITSLELADAVGRAASVKELSGMLLGGAAPATGGRAGLAQSESLRPSVNLRRGEFSYTRDTARMRRSLMLSAALLFAALAVFGLDAAFKIAAAGREMSRAETRMLRTYSDIFPGDKAPSAQGLSYKARAALKDMRARAESLKGVSTLDFLMKLQGSLVPGVKFTEITLDKDTAVLRGDAATLAAIEETKAALERYLSDVRITQTAQSAGALMTFTITAKGEPE